MYLSRDKPKHIAIFPEEMDRVSPAIKCIEVSLKGCQETEVLTTSLGGGSEREERPRLAEGCCGFFAPCSSGHVTRALFQTNSAEGGRGGTFVSG
jgi:hypothetical protein